MEITKCGVEKKSHKYDNLEDVRNLFIDVKVGLFGTYVENFEKFPDKLQKLNEKALSYYQQLKNKKYVNFKGWIIFYKLYCTENVIYYLENFVILNLPIIAKIFFKLRRRILKI